MTARWLGILVLLCAAGGAFGCGSITSNDTDDGGGPEDVGDVPDVGDETPSEVEAEDAAGCEAALTDCDGACVDLSSDPAHCGSCRLACPDGENATPVCSSRRCGLRCDPGWVDVDGSPGCELQCTPAVPPVEACNELDDDCDGLTDNGPGFDCVHGTVESCATTCATSGERTCDSSCHWTECLPPAETCDNIDQNCDGVADEGLYEVVWDGATITPSVTAELTGFSVVIAGGQMVAGYVESSSGTGVLGQPWLQRFQLADGAELGGPIGLASAATAHRIRAAGTGTYATFAWDTGDDMTAAGETLVNRALMIGSPPSLGSAAVLDADPSIVSTMPGVARRAGEDAAIVCWIESPGGAPQLQIASTSRYTRPGSVAWATIASTGQPRDPSIALHGDATVLVVWSVGAPGEVRGQRLNTGLELEGGEMNLSDSPAAASEHPRAASSESGFAVVWEEAGSGVMLALVDPSGGAGSTPTLLASGPATHPVVAPDLLGGFAVAYQTSDGVELVRVDAAGVPQGEPLAFAGGTSPEIASIPEGGLVLGYFHAGAVRLARVGCGP